MDLAHLQLTANVCGPPEGTRIYDQPSGDLLEELPVWQTSLDLASLNLADGRHTLGLASVDQWGSETPADQRATIAVTVEGGSPAADLVPPTNPRTWAEGGGSIGLTFLAADVDGAHQRPAEYEIAEADDLATILTTVDGAFRQATVSVGPFADGRTVRLRVRASDGQPPGSGGTRGKWVAAPAIVADASAPPAPGLADVTEPCE